MSKKTKKLEVLLTPEAEAKVLKLAKKIARVIINSVAQQVDEQDDEQDDEPQDRPLERTYEDDESPRSLAEYDDLVAEWHPKRNAFEGTPDDFNDDDTTTVWWKCSLCGKSWQASICDRVDGFGNCPNPKCF